MAVLPRIVALLLVGLVAGPLPAHLTAWSPLLELGDRGEALPSAIVKVASLTKLAEAVTYKLAIDPKTQALFDDVSDKLETLDPESMYGMMKSSPLEASRHAMSVYGELSNTGDYRVVSTRSTRPARFGDLAVTFAMKPARGESYLLETDIAAHLEVTADELGGVASGSMNWIRATANLHGARAGDGLDDSDREIGRGLSSAFPAMSALAMKYFEPLDGVARSLGSVRGRLVGRLRRDAFAKDYPQLAELLTDDVKAKTRARVTTLDGRTLAVIKIDSARGEGAIVFEVDPDRWISDQYRVQVDLDADMFGMHLGISNVEVRTSVAKNGRAISLRSVFNRTPAVVISGAALGIVPIEVVDAVIPSSVQSIVESFLSTLAKTDAGKGASLTVVLPEKQAEPMRFTSRAELLNNGFVSFWLQLASSEVLANDAILAEMQRLQERCLTAFSADFVRFQEQAL